MTKLAKSLMCIQMRSGVEIWLEKDRAEKLQIVLKNLTSHKFVDFDDQTINTADIVGIFTAQNMADHTRRKNGQWQCQNSGWHERGERCECMTISEKEFIKKRAEVVAKCGKCRNGHLWVQSSNTFIFCECIRDLEKEYSVKKS